MSKQFEHYREFDYQEDYERLAWEREKQINEQWELEELNDVELKYKNTENAITKSNS